MFDQYQYDPSKLWAKPYEDPQQNYADAFSGGTAGTMVVDARKNPDGTMTVTRVRPGGDPHWTQHATFSVDPSTGQPTQVSDWGGDQKDGPAGKTIGQGLALAGLAAGGLGAAGFLGGAGAGAGAGLGATEIGGTTGGLGAAEGAGIASGGTGISFPGAWSGIGGEAGLGGTASALGASGVGGGGGGILSGLGSLGGLGSGLGSISNGTLLNLGGNLLNGYLGSQAANKAADAQRQAAADSNALLKSIYDQNRADNAPMLATRNLALGGLNGLISNPGSIVNDPGYKFGLDQGVQALDRSAAARGNLYSGATIKGQQRFGQDYAGTKLDQSYNRLSNAAGLGQVGANNNQTASMNYGNQAQQNITGAGNAAGSAYIGSSNAWGGALNNALGSYNQNALLEQLLKNRNGLGG